MGKYKLACSFTFILVYLFPLFLSAQTLTLDPTPAPSEPQDRILGDSSAAQDRPSPASVPSITSLELKATMGPTSGTITVPQEGGTNTPLDVQDRAAPAPRPPITSVDLQATMGSPRGSFEASPGSSPATPLSVPQEGARKATLDAQVRPAPSPRPPLSSIELQATKVLNPEPLVMPWEREWIMGLALLLILSLVGNAFQFYRHRLFGKTLGNELLSTFNSVSWSLARCLNKTRELEARSAGGKNPDPVTFKEFREFSLDSEFMLRTLREHLGTVARNLRQKDRRWETGSSFVSLDEPEKIEGALPESSESQRVQDLAIAGGKPKRNATSR